MNNFSAIRISAATVLALLITTVMFSQLYSLTTPAFTLILKPAKPIVYKPIRTDSPLVVKTYREPKPTREDPVIIPGGPGIEIEKQKVGPQKFTTEKFTKGDISIEQPPLVPTGSDRDVMPLLHITPDYPQRAALRNIEGWVRVRFNITSAGSVSDVMVVASEPQGYFEKAATDAIARWRYSPKVEEGLAVERRGVETQLRFELPSQ